MSEDKTNIQLYQSRRVKWGGRRVIVMAVEDPTTMVMRLFGKWVAVNKGAFHNAYEPLICQGLN